MPLSFRPSVTLSPAELERFWAKVDVAGPGACWRWTANTGRDGYARCWAQGADWLAHRVAYELLVEPIADGMTLDHTCHSSDKSCTAGARCLHRRCVNPAHLEPVTFEENLARQRRTHCIHGHALTPDNLLRGSRQCRTCHYARNRARQARLRALQAQGATS